MRHVPPAVDLERFAAIPERPPRTDGPLRVLYAGTLGIAQVVGVLLQAAALAGPEIVELVIAGEGAEGAALEQQARGLANVELLGAVPAARIPALYEGVDAGVVPLRDLPIFSGALPTKLFEVLAAGRPAIVAARGEAAELVREAGAGVIVSPEDPQALAEAFQTLRGAPPEQALQMGRRARLTARAFSRAGAVERWYELLRNLEASRR